ncbi:S8 family peptidase [Virgibacillus sp. LDC-1]|uniref:S8 family peptidase n=1 Tax=Virgibacillus sp. LDC-1 TaxID=3039856 RepID=UPI0024DEDC69|nr:S8 family peptidase [Virgibacillus sp. LDC-1]
MKSKFLNGLAIALFIIGMPIVSEAAVSQGGEELTKETLEGSAVTESRFVKDEVIVKFNETVSNKVQQELLKKLDAKELPDLDAVKSPFKILKVKNVEAVVKALNNNPNVAYAEPNFKFNVAWSPNDTYFSPNYQYGLFHTYANTAWDVAKGSTGQEIAVLDTGVDYNHADLDGKTILGYDFVDQDYTPNDLNGHGTHVAGIAAAETNNGVGIAGMAPNTRILAVRVLDARGSGSLANVADGIRFAADNGAEVINLSLGCDCNTTTLENAVNYAWNKGAVIIAAAGNDGVSTTFEPASYANVIAVGATDRNDRKASFSNYGTWVDVMAPGVDIASTYPNNRYVYLSGTSMASPYVAGLAGLLTGQGKNNSQVRAAIQNTADTIPGKGTYFKYGIINAFDAVNY